MEERIQVAFLGWHDDAQCLFQAWSGDDSPVSVAGVILSEEGRGPLLPGVRVAVMAEVDKLCPTGPILFVIDLRADGSVRPQGLPKGVVWVPPELGRVMVELCRRQVELGRYRGVVETAKDAVVTIDASHRIVFFNRAAEEMFGFSKEEVLGRDLSMIIPATHRASHREYVRRYVDTRSGRFINHTVSLAAERRSGEIFPIDISFSVADEGGQLLMTAVMRDTTEIKVLEKRAQQNERLVSVGQALSYVTHEIRNPLIVIGGFARSLLKNASFQGEERHRLEIIGTEVQRLEGLLSEIQDFAKPLRLEREEIHVAEFLEEILALFRGAEVSSRVSFSLNARGDPVISVDVDRLKQVLLNLLKNATEAMSGEGSVRIQAWRQECTAFVEIRDTGDGIPPSRLEEVFQPFVTSKKGGSGLGLPLCRKIVRDHGGEISMESQLGEGTCVLLSFPAVAP